MPEPAKAPPPLKLDGFTEWLIERGLQGLPLEDQFGGYCQKVYDAGFLMKRVSMAMATLHPRYGARTYVWRPGQVSAEYVPRERTEQELADFRRSPVHYLRESNTVSMRRRLDTNEELEFPLLNQLREEGMTEYAARILSYNATESSAEVGDGIFFSCATDVPGGFDERQLDQITGYIPYVALAVKSRATYDVAHTVIETYLGQDAGHRVLTGEIERGSVDTIRAVIWFCDLRGFTALADSLPSDQLIEVLDDYLDVMAKPVHDNKGQILKFLGDGFLATFDLTQLSGEAVCQNALKAAAELRRAFTSFNKARKIAGGPTMDFGLALHLGDVLYGNIGATGRLDFTVIGPAVNEASRIQALCRSLGTDVLVSAAFHEIACACHGELASLGSHELRGLREPQELFGLAS